ncbi:exopolysaccharide biosynthesis protein [Nocardioides flavus (ex Wang et al. 2016)]|uniref:Exopolysaccharide biosynthesis protein n=1 Tax=Nocardioides flavus (ex Wang et al. 2016) TaxID=2058780 RepID=A0ABQ3HJA3_9ACTN|nr:phosphodiester glycosidase family protein [Nocardioides flavus (ex Wang et al. 2016)]GHE17735.1 exopolysaccharide biosynthesis protein [Nocardioides flavus (ex Wang et al. 2016)]
MPTRTPSPTRPGFLVGGITALALTAGSSAWALDRYVVDHVQVADASAYEAAHGSDGTVLDTDQAVLTDDSWSADGTTITVREVSTGTGDQAVTYFVADLVLSDATVLKSAFAGDSFGTNVIDETSDIAEQNGAIFAINGDYYGFRDTGIVIRNGVAYRDEGTREGLAFYRDGHVELYDETATDAQSLVDAGVWNALSFGPALIADGQVLDGIDDVEVDTNFGNHSIQGDQPRTAVGVIDDNHLVLVVVDGRDTGYSAGASMTELATLMRGLGATTAYNLDGGGSSTMYFNGEVINRPSNGGERGTSDILYVRG